MKTVKFFVTPVYPYGNDHYYHEIIGVAEGFAQLGWTITGNCNYWYIPEKKEYLLKEDVDNKHDIAIYDYRYVRSFEHILFRMGYPNFDSSKIHILVDRNDWIAPIWLNKHYRVFDFIFSGNIYNNVKYPKNVYPWVIGLTQRIINYIDKSYSDNEPAEEIIGHNFRITHNLRELIFDNLSKKIKKYPLQLCLTESSYKMAPFISSADADGLYWRQSTGRHNPSYFKLLNSKLLFFSFGGYYEYKPLCYQPYSVMDKIRRKPYFYYSKLLKKLNKDISPAHFIFQYDNFRFWEILYSRSCPISIDLESWNFLLPEMPVNREHYLGIHKFKFNDFVEYLEALSINEIKKMGFKGREWVKKNYSPAAQAKRIITLIENKK